jgi:hypothetical protein
LRVNRLTRIDAAEAYGPRVNEMAFKVQVGPAQIAIHQGQTVLVTEPDGQVNWPSERGLYFRDTRVISAWAIYANGTPWDLLNGGAVSYHAARIFDVNRAFMSEDGPVAAHTLGLVIGRHIDGGLHEDIEITNNNRTPVRFNLEIAIRADFADLFEVKSNQIVRRGRITTSWVLLTSTLAVLLSPDGTSGEVAQQPCRLGDPLVEGRPHDPAGAPQGIL